MTNDSVKKLERELAGIEASRDRVYDILTNQEEAAKQKGRDDLAQVARQKRVENLQRSAELLQNKRAELEQARAKLAKVQAEQERQQAEKAAFQERMAKNVARRSFSGTDTEFEARWPELWKEIQRAKVVDQMRQPPARSTFRF